MLAIAAAPSKQSGALQVIVPSGSPFVWTNTGDENQLIMLGGGTVTLVEVAQDGITFLGASILAGVFLLKPGGKLRITYLILPLFVYVIDF